MHEFITAVCFVLYECYTELLSLTHLQQGQPCPPFWHTVAVWWHRVNLSVPVCAQTPFLWPHGMPGMPCICLHASGVHKTTKTHCSLNSNMVYTFYFSQKFIFRSVLVCSLPHPHEQSHGSSCVCKYSEGGVPCASPVFSGLECWTALLWVGSGALL